MREPWWTLLLRYGAPTVSALLAVLLTWLLQPLLASGHFLFFLASVAIGASVADFRGGLLAALLCAMIDVLCLDLTAPPSGIISADAWLNLALFLLAAVLLSCLIVMLRAAGRQAAEMRRQITQLSEADRRKDEFLAVQGHELRNARALAANALHISRRLLDESDVASERPGRGAGFTVGMPLAPADAASPNGTTAHGPGDPRLATAIQSEKQ